MLLRGNQWVLSLRTCPRGVPSRESPLKCATIQRTNATATPFGQANPPGPSGIEEHGAKVIRSGATEHNCKRTHQPLPKISARDAGTRSGRRRISRTTAQNRPRWWRRNRQVPTCRQHRTGLHPPRQARALPQRHGLGRPTRYRTKGPRQACCAAATFSPSVSNAMQSDGPLLDRQPHHCDIVEPARRVGASRPANDDFPS